MIFRENLYFLFFYKKKPAATVWSSRRGISTIQIYYKGLLL
jgi:hypothetical protein